MKKALRPCPEGVMKVQMQGHRTSVLPGFGALCGGGTGDAVYISDWDWATILEGEERERKRKYGNNLICAK